MSDSWATSCSVPGAPGRSCQDASGVSPEGDAVVVADGLGSARRAAEAARLAVSIVLGPVRDAVQAGVPVDTLPVVLAAAWHERTGSERALATTVLMAIRGPAYTVVGQVGDGLVLVFDPEPHALDPGKGAFGNETACLPHDPLQVHVASPEATVFLATDGVADDLVPDRQPALVQHLLAQRGEHGSAALDTTLRQWLTDWRTPSSHDDRSVGLLALEDR